MRSSVRITARCTGCGDTFTAREGDTGPILAEDVRERLACDNCICSYCEQRHLFPWEHDECEQDRAESAAEFHGRVHAVTYVPRPRHPALAAEFRARHLDLAPAV